MKSTDKILIGIVSGALVVVLVAFLIVLTSPEDTYSAAGDPESVVHNYLLAVQNEDYERAYGYLSPNLQGYPPSAETFAQNLNAYDFNYYATDNANLTIVSSEISNRRASVIVSQANQDSSRMLFLNSIYLSDFEVNLSLTGGEWKITDSDFYFSFCWNLSSGCAQ